MGAGWTPYNVGIELENKKKSKKKKTRFTKDITEIKSL